MFDQNLGYYLELGLMFVISLSFHELAHARTALAFGDPTAKMMGRVTLNPLAHLDIWGAVVFMMTGGLGWAKPVPVNPANLHPPRLGDFMVSLAGPMANFALAGVGAIAIRIAWHFPAAMIEHKFLTHFLAHFIWWNLGLMIFNLIPLYPLDGHHMQRDLLPAPSGVLHAVANVVRRVRADGPDGGADDPANYQPRHSQPAGLAHRTPSRTAV